MDTLDSEQVNNGKTEYGLTGQTNTGSKLRRPPLDSSEDGLLAVRGVESGKLKVQSPEGPFLPVDVLRGGARELGTELDDARIGLLDRFASLLVETNRTLNLTRITEPAEIVTGHYLDSLTCLAAFDIPQGARVIDVGTGAGFPGIPIKIARPDLDVTLLDSSAKKLKFIESAAAEISVEVNVVHARAEDAGRNAAHREAYDVAVTRALADMKTLAELCLPLVRVGGVLIAQKSEDTGDEIDAARPIIGQLGGRIDEIARIAIPGTEITRRLVVVSKAKLTPPEFPRAYSRIVTSKRA
jgi:16S rRNA (guanine527-N7)-methyltransferase